MVQRPGQNTRKPVIGVTGNDRQFSPSWFCIQGVIRLVGGSPKRISVRQELDADQLDAVVVSGGDDIHPTLYGADPDPKVFYDVERDELEQKYINLAIDRGLPLLGICRGYQLINVVLGGTLLTDIRALRLHTLNRRGLLATKNVHLDHSSQMATLLASDHIRVNSLHFQAIDRVADGLKAVAWDRDNIIQAVEAPQQAIMGVQWHPEYLFYLARQRRLFDWLLTATNQR